jgi:hypothetical protein
MARCRRKPIVEAPVSAFQDPHERGAEPLGRLRGKIALEPLGWKQTGIFFTVGRPKRKFWIMRFVHEKSWGWDTRASPRKSSLAMRIPALV